MKIKSILGFTIVSIFVFLFNADYVEAKEFNCQYEMLPVGYSVDFGKNIVRPYDFTKATLEYKGKSDSDKKVSVTTFKNKSTTFNASELSKSVFKNKKCPSYIDVSLHEKSVGTKGIEVILTDKLRVTSKEQFLVDQNNSMLDKNGTTFPLYLVSENGKRTTKYALVSANAALTTWSEIMNTDKEGKNSETAKKYYNLVYNNPVYSELSEKSIWKKFGEYALKSQAAVQAEQELNKSQAEYNSATSDYCYYYCSNYCKKYTESNAHQSCTSTCNGSIKPKCESSYNACRNVQDSTSKTECIKGKFNENGLDTSYISTRANEMVDLQSEIERLKKTVKTAQASKINIGVGISTYKLKCDDVTMLHDIWIILVILAPALTVLMGVLDFSKSVMSGDDKKIQEAWKKFPKRLAALIVFLLTPLIISVILGVAEDKNASDTNLMRCVINGGD